MPAPSAHQINIVCPPSSTVYVLSPVALTFTVSGNMIVNSTSIVDNAWYPDSSASTHLSNFTTSLSLFHTLDLVKF